jgi:UDP-2,4-diacetamido-2,4,6-trideoxy-beta-L-altropyranose hydrolase
MRCLALADAMKRRGTECHFVCREDNGDALQSIRLRGHNAHGLPGATTSTSDFSADAAQTRAIVAALHPEWLVVDHYLLGRKWESEVRSATTRLFVIDDIGRAHTCDLLLDQNFQNPIHTLYRKSLGADTQLLLGPEFALLRPEFAVLRSDAMRRPRESLVRILVSMGGTDPGNETGKVLAGIMGGWQAPWLVDVVVGRCNPHLKAIADACTRMPNATLHVQTEKMAELMLAADCAITAGGSTTWERCCLGLPALVTVVSADQRMIAEAVAKAGAQVLLGCDSDLAAHDYAASLAALSPISLRDMSAAAASICDGVGAERVAARLH